MLLLPTIPCGTSLLGPSIKCLDRHHRNVDIFFSTRANRKIQVGTEFEQLFGVSHHSDVRRDYPGFFIHLFFESFCVRIAFVHGFCPTTPPCSPCDTFGTVCREWTAMPVLASSESSTPDAPKSISPFHFLFIFVVDGQSGCCCFSVIFHVSHSSGLGVC